jgi:uncharacterized protein
MSAADVEVIRELYDRFNRRDYEGSMAMMHPDIEMRQAREIPGAGTWIGRDEVERGLVAWLSGFERGFQYEMVELKDCGDRVFVDIMLRGTGRGSGVSVEQRIFNVWETRDGKASLCLVYFDEGEAREAAGLQPA